MVASTEDADAPQEQEEVQPEAETQETTVLEEITEEEEVEEVEEQVEEAIAEAQATGDPLPENIQKLMDFMEETGGDLNDYVKLNQDYGKLEEVVEETTQETTEQVDESKFESAGDDSVMKVDLSKPPTPKEENETK